MKTKFLPKFYRHFPEQKSECDINMKVSCTDSRLSYSIGYSISKKDWSEAKQMPKDQHHLLEITDRINDLKSWVKEFTKGQKAVLRDDLKAFLLMKDGKRPLADEGETNAFFDAIDRLVDSADSGKLLQDDLKPFAASTVKNWRASKNRLVEFNPHLSFDHNTEATYNEFKNWAAQKGLGTSYIDKLMKDWRSFFKYSGRPVRPFKRLGVGEPDKPYLDTKEIAMLEAVELTGTDEEI